ncbi:MAG: tetratricopeptide repeat protein [Rhodobacteraceae bacterium]|nr:tetratricopeptide repeat protein [Paracoccaceae bacterium]
MSETDSFIDEVTEEVRRDKLFAIFRRYGWIGIALVVAIVGGAAWNEWQKARATSDARAFGDAVLAALETSDPQARVAALDTVAGDDGRDRDAVAEFLAADEALRGGDRDGALARLETMAADPALNASLRDLARLKSVVLAGAGMDAAERDATLAELAMPGAPYRVLAMEQQAIVMADAGDTEGALKQLRLILEEPDATAGLRRRVTQLIVVLGGDPEAA